MNLDGLKQFLVTSKVMDPDGTVSLTNLMMGTLIGKVATSAQLDWTVVSALFLSLAAYNGKKWFARDKVSKVVGDGERLAKLETEIRSLVQASNFKSLTR